MDDTYDAAWYAEWIRENSTGLLTIPIHDIEKYRKIEGYHLMYIE